MTQQGEESLATKSKTSNHHHKHWRHQVVSDILGPKLSEPELQQALRICDEDFASDEDFSAAEFFSRFTASVPSAKLGKEIRILFLQTARMPNGAYEQGTDASSEATTSTSQPQSATPSHAPTENESERRANPRKFTNLEGSCRRLEGEQESIAIVIENLSVTGARIRLQHDCELTRGEVIRIEFMLDDAFRTSLRLNSEVRWVLSDLVGIEFVSPAGLPNILTHYIQS